eukprot:gb/GEZN01006994.1/.p1 GENE.gb/GEZN01006994.1/~~gb/GEZN01006994.1/.p1  ORF type:complete len:462 (+),score=39.71 gb/GEZN01006994.1/:145-1530(+)
MGSFQSIQGHSQDDDDVRFRNGYFDPQGSFVAQGSIDTKAKGLLTTAQRYRSPNQFKANTLFGSPEWSVAAVKYFRDTLDRQSKSSLWRHECTSSKPHCERLMIGKYQARGPMTRRKEAANSHPSSITAMNYVGEVIAAMRDLPPRVDGVKWARKNYSRLLRVYVHLGTEHRILLRQQDMPSLEDSRVKADAVEVSPDEIRIAFQDFLRFGYVYGLLNSITSSVEVNELAKDFEAMLSTDSSRSPLSLLALLSPTQQHPYFLLKFSPAIMMPVAQIRPAPNSLPGRPVTELFKRKALLYFYKRLVFLNSIEFDKWCGPEFRAEHCTPMRVAGKMATINKRVVSRKDYMAGLKQQLEQEYESQGHLDAWVQKGFQRLMRVYIHAFGYHSDMVLQSEHIWQEFVDFIVCGLTYGLLKPTGETAFLGSHVALAVNNIAPGQFDDQYFGQLITSGAANNNHWTVQ